MSNINITKIIKHPRITEKASFCAEQNVYTFDVAPSANKTEVKKAIFELYKVKAEKVNILKMKAKKIFVKGREGKKAGGKKALVYLKKGAKIEFI